MKAYIVLANGFEVLEAFSPLDVLKRCGAEVITVSINVENKVETSQKNIFYADKTLKNLDCRDGDVLIIPGGYPGYVNLRDNIDIVKLVKYYLENNKIVAAICGGPTVFSANKIACGRELTGHSSIKNELLENHIYVEKNIHKDGNIITGVGAGHSLDFAFLIAESFFNNETISKVKKGMELY